jgi:hypothetical protein
LPTPTIVQHVASPNSATVAGSGTSFTLSFPHGTTNGNVLLLHDYRNSGGFTDSSVADDKGQNWTLSTSTLGTNANGYVWFFAGSTAGAKQVTVTVAAGTNSGDFHAYSLSEWFNVSTSAPIRGNSINEGVAASTDWTAGSISPLTSNLVYQSAVCTAWPLESTTVYTAQTSAGGPSYQLECADLMDGYVAQSAVSASTTHTPTIHSGKSATWLSLATELNAASAGSDSTSPFRVKRAQGSNFKFLNVAAPAIQFPCDGNLIVTGISNVTAAGITSVTLGSTSLTHINNSPVTNGVGGTVAFMYTTGNFTPARTTNGVWTWTSVPAGGATAWFMDVVGAATSGALDASTVTSSGVGTVGSNTGNQGAAGNLSVFQFNPSSGTELAINYLDHNSGSETGMADTSIAMIEPYAGQDGAAGGDWTMDSGLAIKLINVATSFTYTRSATAAGNWETLGALFKSTPSAAGTASVVAPRLTLLGVR